MFLDAILPLGTRRWGAGQCLHRHPIVDCLARLILTSNQRVLYGYSL